MTIGGTLTSPSIVATAANTITVGNGGASASSIVTGTTTPSRKTGNVGQGNANPFPAPGASLGAFFTSANFAQTGTTVINGGSGGFTGVNDGTLRINITGTATFGGLQARTTQVFLSLGNGTATGTVNLGGFNVLTATNQTGSANLIGSVHGLPGVAAAGESYIDPKQNAHYILNSCPIQSVNCVLLSPLIVPVTNPIQDIDVGTNRKRRDDDDLILPNVAEQDY